MTSNNLTSAYRILFFLQGMSADDAMKAYIEKVDGLVATIGLN